MASLLKRQPSGRRPASTEWGFSDAEGTAWIARVAGTARSGVIADSGAALMVVRFFRAGDESEKPRGELLTVARDLAELFPDEWQALLAEATPQAARRPSRADGDAEADYGVGASSPRAASHSTTFDVHVSFSLRRRSLG